MQQLTRPTLIDVDTCLHEALQANNHEGVQWFTHTILHRETTVTQQQKRPRTLNALHNCCTTKLRRMEHLTRKNLHAMTHTYLTATTCVHAMKKWRDLRSMYHGPLRANRKYHHLVDTCLRDEINLMHIQQRWQQHVVHSQEAYHGDTHHALTSYLDNATLVGLHTRYLHHVHRLQTYKN